MSESYSSKDELLDYIYRSYPFIRYEADKLHAANDMFYPTSARSIEKALLNYLDWIRSDKGTELEHFTT